MSEGPTTDWFALLGQQRRPWLDPARLKEQFLQLATEAHPDRTHSATPSVKALAGQTYTDLNAAYNCLRDPRERLKYLLELETGRKPAELQAVSAELADQMMELGRVCREADALIAAQANATSPMLKVQFLGKAHEAIEVLMVWRDRLHAQRQRLESELVAADQAWVETKASSPLARLEQLAKLEQLYRAFSFANRWTNQVQERIFKLSP